MALRDDLHTWFSAQPRWQQDIAGRLVSRADLDGPGLAEALRVVKSAFRALPEGETAVPPKALALGDLPASATAGAPRLTAFGRLRGVGAVSSEYELRFAVDGLTVIYGQNAVGKTSYVRALKRVCRAVDRDSEVLGNVFAQPGTGGPSAMVEVSVPGGEPRAQRLDLATPQALGLEAISVFDAQCAELYVDSQNAVAFVPAALRVLARLAATQDRLRTELDHEIATLTREPPVFPEFAADTTVKSLVGQLSAGTKFDAVRARATLDEAERARLTDLRAVLAATEASTGRADAQAAREDARQAEVLAGQLRELAARVSEPAQEKLRGLAKQAESAEAAAELAAREFSDLPVAGVGGGPWRQLWQAARQFAEQAGAPFPSLAGQPCPLCLQELTVDAAARLSHFESHVRSAVQAAAQEAREALDSALEPLESAHVEACRTPFLTGLREREPEMHSTVERYLEAAGSRMAALRANPATAHVLPLPDDPVPGLASWGNTRGDHADVLLAAESPEQETLLRAELAELDARDKLAARLPEIQKWLGTLVRIAALRTAHGALATNRITTKQRQFSEQVVTGALDAKLREELDNLDCSHLPVGLQPETRVGETHVALRLAGARGAPKVSEIASEGEQRALSMSFFLAEIATSEGDGGIVFDDPVSSLDDERRNYIAKRLVAETARRQVIVFTHDLPFMLDLIDRAEEAGLEPLVQGLWRLGSEVGRVDDHPPFKAMKLRPRIGILDQEVAQWDKQDPPRNQDEAWRRVCDFYSRLRTTWERAVEERLFRGVVTRFQREVKTKSLDEVVVTPELVALVKAGMTRCSMFLHDEPLGANTRLPDRARIAQDLDQLHDFMSRSK